MRCGTSLEGGNWDTLYCGQRCKDYFIRQRAKVRGEADVSSKLKVTKNVRETLAAVEALGLRNVRVVSLSKHRKIVGETVDGRTVRHVLRAGEDGATRTRLLADMRRDMRRG